MTKPMPVERVKLTKAQRAMLELVAHRPCDRRGTLSAGQWEVASRLEGMGLVRRSMFEVTITDKGRVWLNPNYEVCRCRNLTHVNEAACIHCGRTKAWAQEDCA